MPPKGFTALFNGKNLDGWHGMPHFDPRKLAEMSEADRAKQIAAWTEDAKKHWSVEGDDLVNDGHGAYLTTDKDYGDFELLIDYKTVAKADSGIYLRGTPQVQIWDYTPEGLSSKIGGLKGSGGLFNNSNDAPGRDPLVVADKPFGEWNHFRIVLVGARISVYLNDKLVVDHAQMENFWDRALPLFARGPIQLQTHGGEIRWRNIFIREIPTAEANKILSEHGDKGFTAIFDGKTLEGLGRGGQQLRSRRRRDPLQAAQGGVLFHKDDLSDFAARVQFRLPAGATTGWRSATRGPTRRITPPMPACANCRCSTTRRTSTPSSIPGSTTARSTGSSRPSGATSARSASGTSRKSPSKAPRSRSS